MIVCLEAPRSNLILEALWSFGIGEGAAFDMEMFNYFFDHFAKFRVKADWVVSVNSADQVGALAEVHLILFAPLDPFVKLVTEFHL